MTISTPRTERPSPRARGYTLTEVMISAALATVIFAGVMTAFLMIGRTGAGMSGYSELESQTRRALEIFGNDARNAVDIHWHSAQSITLTLPTATSAQTLASFGYDDNPRSATYGCFYRLAGDHDSTGPRLVLLRHVDADFTFRRYRLENQTDNLATNDLETKLVEVVFRARRARTTTVTATQSALSARYVLRNKRVSN